MSSTNRGDSRTRHKSDFYVTPPAHVRLFLAHWLKDAGIDRPDRLCWLDPAAGGDATHGMGYPDVIGSEFDAPVDSMDIRPDSPAQRKGDYLTEEVPYDWYDVIITNPPFCNAEAFIRKALHDVKDGGYVVMLLRLDFFGSVARFPLFTDLVPTWCYVHQKRMSFTEDGVTDSVEYCHMAWRKGPIPEFTKLKVI
jgi:hypothetical protein